MRWRLPSFVVISLLVHAALFAVWSSLATQRLTIGATRSSAPVLSIVLQQQSGHKTVNRQQTPKQQQHELARKSAEHRASHQPDNSKPSAVAATTHTVATPVSAELQQLQIRDRVLSRIRAHLNQHFVYPLLARREGWQGRVLLGFSVEANGMIRNIHVAVGSGYAILDSSAMSALSRIEQLSEADSWTRGARLDLQMPVIFRLQGG